MLDKYISVKNKGMEYISHNKRYINRIQAGSILLKESVIHIIHVVGGTKVGKNNIQIRIQNGSYFTTIYIAGNWD